MSITVLKDNGAIHEPNQFSKIETLYDSIFERLDEAIDMKKGLLLGTEEVFQPFYDLNRMQRRRYL